MMNRLICALGLFGVLLSPQITWAQSETVNLKTLIEQFNSVVFIHEHGRTGREPKPLVRWEGPVVIGIQGTLKKTQLEELNTVLNRVRKLTNLKMRYAKKGEKPNLTFTFKTVQEFSKQFPKGINCQGKLSGGRDFILRRAAAYIPSDHPEKTSHCIVEETVQLFGLTNDSTVMKNSIFYEESDRLSMSVSDQILLKALYDPRLKAGMQRDEAQPVLRTVMQDILSKASKRRAAN